MIDIKPPDLLIKKGDSDEDDSTYFPFINSSYHYLFFSANFILLLLFEGPIPASRDAG